MRRFRQVKGVPLKTRKSTERMIRRRGSVKDCCAGLSEKKSPVFFVSLRMRLLPHIYVVGVVTVAAVVTRATATTVCFSVDLYIW